MKNILITGASGGIGIEIASQLAKNNNKLFLIYHQNDAELKMLKKTKSKNCKIQIFKCDLTNENSVNTLVEGIIASNHKIDCLINCAGVSKVQQIQDITEQDFDYIFNNNVKTTVNVIKAVVPHMISEKSGKIINISSVWGIVGASTESLYSASKGAINALTLSLAKELGLSGIAVNAICPGFIDTKMNSMFSEQDKKLVANETPLQRLGKPKDIAGLVEFLISRKSSFITGQIIRVDGGWTL